MSKQHIFNVGDVVVFQDSIPGIVINVSVDENNNTLYLVDFRTSCGKFLARDLTLIEEDEK